MSGQGPDGSFEQRLREARGRQGMAEPGAPQPSPAASSPWGVGLRIGVELLAALMVAVAIGWGLDRWLHTMPLFICVFVLLGGAAGVLNVWRMVAPRSPSAGK